jgi:hypothetical protein
MFPKHSKELLQKDRPIMSIAIDVPVCSGLNGENGANQRIFRIPGIGKAIYE